MNDLIPRRSHHPSVEVCRRGTDSSDRILADLPCPPPPLFQACAANVISDRIVKSFMVIGVDIYAPCRSSLNQHQYDQILNQALC